MPVFTWQSKAVGLIKATGAKKGSNLPDGLGQQFFFMHSFSKGIIISVKIFTMNI